MALSGIFGPPGEWGDQDLIAFSGQFDADMALQAYLTGVFPMPVTGSGLDGVMGWWSPAVRGVLPLDCLRVTRSLRRSRRRYTTTIDAAFDEVLAACADPERPGGWIDDRIAEVFGDFRRRGLAHSVETWDAEGRLVGGLFGVNLGGLFSGESMFHDPVRGRDASKVALIALVEHLAADGLDRLIDVQWATGHLLSLGVVEIDRDEYLAVLDEVLALPPARWPDRKESHA